jgi:para-nitrobenzyl esterase
MHLSTSSLYLDIWAPSNATKHSKLPVKVWVFGGSDTEGGIEYPLYDGCNLAEKDTIVVSLNYRLGPLGFLALDDAGYQGNQGIQDLIRGFEWVQKSISSFGGDPVRQLSFKSILGILELMMVWQHRKKSSLSDNQLVPQMCTLLRLLLKHLIYSRALWLNRSLYPN